MFKFTVLKFTVALFILSCCLTGYRLVGRTGLAIAMRQSVFAQPALPDTPMATLPSRATDSATDGATDRATPTVAPYFRSSVADPLRTPTTPEPVAVATLAPVAQAATPTTITTANRQAAPYQMMVIYGDELNANWTIEHSEETQTNVWDTSHWFQPLDPPQALTSGAGAIAVSPQADYGRILFSVRPASNAVYQRQDVLGVSLWLNSGNDGIATDDLAITVLGSNELPYWTPDDHSVFPDDMGAFSETRLYFLKINRTIPANTWVNIVLWLNELQFDPVYQYVTGFYIKNDAGFRNTYYLDQVALLIAP